MNVRDAMAAAPVTIGPDASLGAAEALMRTEGVRHLPVVDDSGRLLGMLTDRDLEHAAFVPMLVSALLLEPRWLVAPRVRDVMTWSVVTTQPEVPLVRAALTMFQHRLGSLPVLESGRLVGILTASDALAAFGEKHSDGEAASP